MGKVIKDLMLAVLNATLILIALCLFLAWQLAQTTQAVVDRAAQAVDRVAPVQTELAELNSEISGLRADLAEVRDGAGDQLSDGVQAASERLEARIEGLENRIDGIQARLADLDAITVPQVQDDQAQMILNRFAALIQAMAGSTN